VTAALARAAAERKVAVEAPNGRASIVETAKILAAPNRDLCFVYLTGYRAALSIGGLAIWVGAGRILMYHQLSARLQEQPGS